MTDTGASSGTICPGLAAGRSPILTSPAITAAAARERVSYSPRSASRVSSRRFGTSRQGTPRGSVIDLTLCGRHRA